MDFAAVDPAWFVALHEAIAGGIGRHEHLKPTDRHPYAWPHQRGSEVLAAPTGIEQRPTYPCQRSLPVRVRGTTAGGNDASQGPKPRGTLRPFSEMASTGRPGLRPSTKPIRWVFTKTCQQYPIGDCFHADRLWSKPRGIPVRNPACPQLRPRPNHSTGLSSAHQMGASMRQARQRIHGAKTTPEVLPKPPSTSAINAVGRVYADSCGGCSGFSRGFISLSRIEGFLLLETEPRKQ